MEVELLVFTNIKAISTLECLQLDDNVFLMCNYLIICNTCLNKVVSYEATFSDTAKFSQSAVFNLQAADYVHCNVHTYTLLNFSFINKVFFLQVKNIRISKNSQHFIIHYN